MQAVDEKLLYAWSGDSGSEKLRAAWRKVEAKPLKKAISLYLGQRKQLTRTNAKEEILISSQEAEEEKNQGEEDEEEQEEEEEEEEEDDFFP